MNMKKASGAVLMTAVILVCFASASFADPACKDYLKDILGGGRTVIITRQPADSTAPGKAGGRSFIANACILSQVPFYLKTEPANPQKS